ncbi:MAG TPA: zinc-ribbon domain-containing protein, partial [Polyangiaceae bacterium]
MGVPIRPEAKLKIACQSCQAKYTIADEKVVGKIVKIRCKKCGATIVINGNDPEATSPLPAGETGSEWTVNVAEGDQRTMTTEEIVDAYASGVVTDDTFCWKDGMADWLPLREIEELSGLVGGGSGETAVAQQPAGGADFAPLSVRGFDDQATVPVQRENMGGLFGGGSNGHAESNGNGASLFSGGAPAPAPSAPAQAAPAAARRAGGRAGGADLFGGAAAAGGEEDVMTSAPNGAPPPAAADDGKLTGQRNENSVLFSLSALTSNSPKVEKEKPSADGSGLIDIRALSSTMAADQNKKKEHVDDIMNLGGGGAFSAALTAPILAPPIASADLGSSDVGGEKSNNKKLMAIIAVGFGLLLLVIIFLVVKLASGPKVDDTTATNPTGTATGTGTAPTAAPTDTAAAAGTGTAAAGSTAAGANTGTGATPPGTGAVAANNPPTTSH